MKIKKINSYILINCIFVILATLSFFITYISIKQMGQNDDSIRSIGIGSIANYLRFLPSEYKNQNILELAFHNFGLAFIAYILSMLSFGILGILSLCSAFSVAAIVFSSSPDWLAVVFTCFEVLGISLSVFGGTYIFNKRKRENLSLKRVFIFSIGLIVILAVIYLIAAYIETGLIRNILR